MSEIKFTGDDVNLTITGLFGTHHRSAPQSITNYSRIPGLAGDIAQPLGVSGYDIVVPATLHGDYKKSEKVLEKLDAIIMAINDFGILTLPAPSGDDEAAKAYTNCQFLGLIDPRHFRTAGGTLGDGKPQWIATGQLVWRRLEVPSNDAGGRIA